jgi:hypothetical protein
MATATIATTTRDTNARIAATCSHRAPVPARSNSARTDCGATGPQSGNADYPLEECAYHDPALLGGGPVHVGAPRCGFERAVSHRSGANGAATESRSRLPRPQATDDAHDNTPIADVMCVRTVSTNRASSCETTHEVVVLCSRFARVRSPRGPSRVGCERQRRSGVRARLPCLCIRTAGFSTVWRRWRRGLSPREAS